MRDFLHTYLAHDRLQALAREAVLPDRSHGTALLADLSGFTPLTEALALALGPRQGAEVLSTSLNQIYSDLIAQVEHWRGSVISFQGDAITCWFDDADGPAAPRAAACALAMQRAMQNGAGAALREHTGMSLTLKVAAAYGSARRFVVGDAAVRLFDVLAGATLLRMAALEQQTQPGEVLLDERSAGALRLFGPQLARRAGVSGNGAALLHLEHPPEPNPWPALPPQALAPEQLRPWVLPAIYERYTAGLGSFVTELRPVVTMFVRFSGIDYDHDPDAQMRLDVFVCAAQQTLAFYDGSVLQVMIGDKGSTLYSIFGAPTAHEDDGRRAILAALELRQLTTYLPGMAPLQIGISQGMLMVGDTGGETRRTYSALGDAVNLAARLMSAAAPGEILVSGQVQRAVASDVMLEPRLPIRVKGKAEPQPVAAVQAPRARKVFRLEEPRHALPMVGRDAERSRIAEIQSLALAGRGQVVGVLGAAGIGKSRLLADAIRLAHQRGLTGYGAACLATGQNSPYLAWAPIWQAFFHVDPDAPISLQARALAQALEDLVPDHQEALPLLGPLLRLALPENSFTRALPPNMRRAALHSLLRDCLATAARAAHQTGGGLLLVLEDLHWIDSASLDLLHDLARAIGDLPILIMLSYRPPDDPPPQLLRIESLPHTARIALESLSLADAEQLIETKLAQLFPSGDDGLAPAGLAAQITDLAQGSPFYIEELLNYLRDRAIDPRTARLDQIELPDSLHRLVLSRLGQLSARQQALLKSASIIGRRFPLDWLRGAFGALHPAETLSADLAALARADLVTIDTPEPELAYVFKHVVTQEVVYTSMSAATRAMLHEQLADYLEHLSGSAPERPLDLLAYHYERGADPLKRRHYLRRAGEAAAARFANEAAADYFTRALNMTPPEEHAERFELLLARERTHHLMGRRADQASDLSALEDQANLLDDDARRALVAERRAHHALLIQDLPAAEPALHAAVRLGLETNATDVAVRAYAWWTWQLWLQGDYSAARRRAAAGLDLAARAGDVAGEALVLTYLALVDERQGRYAEAHAAFARTLQIAQALDNRAGEADALGHLARLISTHHMQPIAWEYARMALDIYRVIGHRRGEVIALEQLALAALRRGALAAALDAALEGLVLARQAGDREIEGQLQHLLGEVAHRAGQHGQAQTAYEQALATAQALAERWAECSRQISLAALRHHQGDQAGALALARAGLATAQAQEVSPEQAAALTVAGHALAAQGRWAEATAAYRETLDLRLRMEQPQYVAEARASLARVALASGDLRAASGYIQSVLPDLALGEVDCADEPLLVYLTCYEVLSAAGDPRVREVLADARSLLQRLSANMPNDEARRSFLAQPISRRIAEALER